MGGDYRRLLPSVDAVLGSPQMRLLSGVRREVVVRLIREIVDDLRSEGFGEDVDRTSLVEMVARDVCERLAGMTTGPRRVINATGVVLHTNLGRAVLSNKAVAAVQLAAENYTDLEFDLESGSRGSRYRRAGDLLRVLTGAEDALVVNNNAAAVWLALNTIARDREVVVSRGQLVEIGDSFRLPRIMESSGASLVEVGTTNRTYLSDYEAAMGEETGLLLHVHPSNFRVVGFTADVRAGDLVSLGRKYDVPVMFDAGSGLLMDPGCTDEPVIGKLVEAGVDVVTFSGDKLLGGPQAGLIIGRKAYVQKMKRNPILRALRIDKLTMAALEATLTAYVREDSMSDLPVVAGIMREAADLRAVADRIAGQIRGDGVKVAVEEGCSSVGGGSLPGQELPGWLVRVECADMSGDDVGSKLRACDPAVIVRVADHAVFIDPRTVREREIADLVRAVNAVVNRREPK